MRVRAFNVDELNKKILIHMLSLTPFCLLVVDKYKKIYILSVTDFWTFCVLYCEQGTIIGRVVWTRGCCGYGLTAHGRWYLRTRPGLRTRSMDLGDVCVLPRTRHLRYTRIRAPSAVTVTGTYVSTRKTRRTRR